MLDKSWLEALILDDANKNRIVKCTELTEEPLTGKNDNYTTVLSRFRMSVELGSGERSTTSFVVKTIPDSEAMRKVHKEFRLIESELLGYEQLVKMEALMSAMEDRRETLWARLVGFNDSTLVFEDLTANGYKPYRHPGWLDEEHSKFLLRALARFHAMGAALLTAKIIDPKKFRTMYFLNKNSMEKFFLPSVKAFRDGILKWSPNWSESASQLSQIIDRWNEVSEKVERVNRTTLNVLSHGDCWKGNFLYKYDVDGRTLSLKFVDFQLTCPVSYVFDLSVLLYSSVDPEIRWNRLDCLLTAYQESLSANMKLYDPNSTKVPTVSEIKDTLEFLRPATIVTLAFYWPLTSNEKNDIALSNTTMHKPDMYTSETSKRILGTELKNILLQQNNND